MPRPWVSYREYLLPARVIRKEFLRWSGIEVYIRVAKSEVKYPTLTPTTTFSKFPTPDFPNFRLPTP